MSNKLFRVIIIAMLMTLSVLSAIIGFILGVSFFKNKEDGIMRIKIATLIIIASLFLGACDLGKESVIKNIKYDLSVEYGVPISDVDVEEIEYGISRFTTNQFKATIKSKNLEFYLVDKDGNNYRRIPIKE